MKKHFAAVIILSLFLINFTTDKTFSKSNSEKNKSFKFEVLSTTDMHGRALPFDVSTGERDFYNIQKAAAIVKKERKNFKKNIILIDNGDLIQGSLLSQYAVLYRTKEENPMITALKEMKYDAWVMGNHEFNYTPEQRKPQIEYARKAGITVLGGNIVLKNNGYNSEGIYVKKGEPFYTPYLLKTIKFEKNKKIRLAIIGLGNANNAMWDKESNYPNLQFNSLNNPGGLLEKEIKKWVKQIKDNHLADIIIVSAHSGKTTDTGIKTTKFLKESQIIQAVQNTEDIALYIYGHDHLENIEKIKNAKGKEIYIINGGGTSVTKNVFTVYFDSNNKIKNYKIDAETINLKNEKEDKKLSKKLSHWYKETCSFASVPFGKFNNGWNNLQNEIQNKTNKDLVLNQTAFNDLIHKVQIWASWQNYETHGIEGATVSITSSVVNTNQDGKISFIPYDGQEISTLQLAQIYKYSNNILCTVDMTPVQLYNWMNTVANKLTTDENGNVDIKQDESVHGVDTFYGIDYIFDLSKPEGKRITSAKINGEDLLSIKHPIRVVLNTYRASGCHGFYKAAKIKEKDYIWESTQYLDETESSIQALLGAYFKEKKQITPIDSVPHSYQSHWKIIPNTNFSKDI